MKREVSKPGGGTLKSPEAPRAEMRKFGAAMSAMIEAMAKSWRNQVFKELNKSTVEKFEDAQTGNFAAVYLKLAERARRKLVKRFDDKRLEELAANFTGPVNERNRKEFYARAEKSIGISRQELEASEGLTSQINAYKLETAQWIKKLRDDTLEEWTSNTLRDMAEGFGLEDILAQFDGMEEKRKGHAQMVARTQIATFNSLTSKARARNLGITEAVWITSSDERVRKSHAARAGRKFNLAKGLYSATDGKTLLPGTDYNCRCDYEMIIPDFEGD
ncbi:minor capsid protein [Marinobacter sp.]|uniref:minor capsid protein n=1 Tax=Marinobacter sp. TaxID=50741 RepID=UPI00257E2A38|nr:minor capsid protein [Marinobacter sp.]|tara:strand:- start:3369 stop:4193 length:825 start_codon:yes stop_codon:yes gene_type:complete